MTPSPRPRSVRPVQVLAHRGARRDAPENTLEAFRRARALGADGVELDVHLSGDGVLVVHHDADAPGLGVLATRTLAEIRTRLPHLPTLDEVLDECSGMAVNVEIKNSPGDADHDPGRRQADAVVARLRSRADAGVLDDVLVSSFDLASIDRVRALDPTWRTGYLSFGVDPVETLERAREHGHGAAHPDAWSLAACVSAVVGLARGYGLELNTWTVNDAESIAVFAAEGVDAVITDVPDVALRALGRKPVPPR